MLQSDQNSNLEKPLSRLREIPARYQVSQVSQLYRVPPLESFHNQATFGKDTIRDQLELFKPSDIRS